MAQVAKVIKAGAKEKVQVAKAEAKLAAENIKHPADKEAHLKAKEDAALKKEAARAAKHEKLHPEQVRGDEGTEGIHKNQIGSTHEHNLKHEQPPYAAAGMASAKSPGAVSEILPERDDTSSGTSSDSSEELKRSQTQASKDSDLEGETVHYTCAGEAVYVGKDGALLPP
eukprot:jgi/Mesen1/3264/ME000019S02679